jgi:hypothetical protein
MENQYIIKYILNQLNQAERLEFEQKLASDNVFKAEYETEKLMHEGLLHHRNEQLRNKLKALREGKELTVTESISEPIPQAKTISLWSKFAAAASILLLISAGMWYFMPGKQQDAAEIFASNYESPKGLDAFRDVSAINDTLTLIDASMRNNQWADAKQKALSYLSVHPNEFSIQLALGVCHLETNDFSAADTIFKLLMNNRLMKDNAKWYYSMSLLKQNRKEEALKILEDLATTGSGELAKKAKGIAI